MRKTLSNLKGVRRKIIGRRTKLKFTNSASYWEERYQTGGNSGTGSYGRLAEFKAEVLDSFVAKRKVKSVIEFGPGDGNQLSLATYPAYTGVDISQSAVKACEMRFAEDQTKAFMTVADYDGRRADLALSLDVIFHLVEDEVFETYMTSLFDAAERFVIIYSSNKDDQNTAQHVRHRKFIDWVTSNRPTFALAEHIPNRYPYDKNDQENTSFADFYMFEKAV